MKKEQGNEQGQGKGLHLDLQHCALKLRDGGKPVCHHGLRQLDKDLEEVRDALAWQGSKRS